MRVSEENCNLYFLLLQTLSIPLICICVVFSGTVAARRRSSILLVAQGGSTSLLLSVSVLLKKNEFNKSEHCFVLSELSLC